jgi:hypothetical protein
VALIPRPLVAASTPLTILARSNGSVEPSDLTTVRGTSSTRSNVVKRWPHDGHLRRRRTAAPSLARRESTTLVSSAWHSGQCTAQGYVMRDRRPGPRQVVGRARLVALPAPQRHPAPRRDEYCDHGERLLGGLTTPEHGCNQHRHHPTSDHDLRDRLTNTRTRNNCSQSSRTSVRCQRTWRRTGV